jgi:IS5 family transposase
MDIPTAQRHPARPGKDKLLAEVATMYALATKDVLDRRNREAFRTAVSLLRTACNLPLKEVAGVAGISAGRVSQIQHAWLKGERGRTETQERLAEKFKV